ncbi:MAG: DUF1957 domain-containing protein [Deltaproteobacteria bacterium]|nr:DUF1957 domain-containing protein [Deltaproteobacteria bacterium]
MPSSGHLALVLHAHLPFVRHPEHERFLEEDWLYEAISECYVPLLDVFARLHADGIDHSLSIVLTPTLVSMLGDELLIARYLKHLDRLIDLACRERQRTRSDPRFHRLAAMYLSRLLRTRRLFVDRHRCDLVGAFSSLAHAGRIELLTCAATHAYLPLLAPYPPAVRAQIHTAVDCHTRAIGLRPTGIWLPECGYCPELEPALLQAGIRYTFVDAHGLLLARPRPEHGVFAPVMSPRGLVVFGRDLVSSRQVWSAESGYPGHPVYREFYRDIGLDLDLDYIRPYVQATGQRKNTGIKYYRITGPTHDKQPYLPEIASRQAAAHAVHFVSERIQLIEQIAALMPSRPAFILSPFDAELFGHWWFEGPVFIEHVFREMARQPETISPSTPGAFLSRRPVVQQVRLALSSWGKGGYSEMWLNDSNDWIYRHIHEATERMITLAETHRRATGLLQRALAQAAREILLAQASDWAFIIKTNTSVEYAVRRIREHLDHFWLLAGAIEGQRIDPLVLAELERSDNLFPEIDFRLFCQSAPPRLG